MTLPQCVCGILHLFGHLGRAGAQLPGVSDVSQHKGKRAKGTHTGAETHCGSAPCRHVQQAPQHRAHSTARHACPRVAGVVGTSHHECIVRQTMHLHLWGVPPLGGITLRECSVSP